MLRVEERDGPAQVAEVFLTEDGIIPFEVCLSPYRRHSGDAPWYWRPHRGPWQLFEVQVALHNGPLAGFTCVSIREGLSVRTHARPEVKRERTAVATVCVVSDVPWFTPRETADPDPIPTPSHFPVTLDEPIGVLVEVFTDAIRATWLGEMAVAEAIVLPGNVALLLDETVALRGLEIRDLASTQIAEFIDLVR